MADISLQIQFEAPHLSVTTPLSETQMSAPFCPFTHGHGTDAEGPYSGKSANPSPIHLHQQKPRQ